MLYWAAVFLIISIVAAFLGFGGIAGSCGVAGRVAQGLDRQLVMKSGDSQVKFIQPPDDLIGPRGPMLRAGREQVKD